MILTLLGLQALQTGLVSEFFPTAPGTVRTYEEKKGTILINTIGKPLDMGGVAVTPITESAGGGNGKTTYYRVENDQVSIVAYDVKKPLPISMPVVRIGNGNGKVTWDFQGKTAVGSAGERLWARGEAHMAGVKTVLGQKVETLNVYLRAAIGSGMSGYTIEQDTTYGKGLGIVEQKTTFILGKKKTETNYKLVSIKSES